MEKEIIERVERLIHPLIEGEGMELVAVEYKCERVGRILRIYIDKESGITIDDCARISSFINTVLDVEDFIPSSYHLEVSSPGADRVIKKEKDFIRFQGQEIRLKTLEPINLRKNYRGTLLGTDDGKVLIEVDKVTYTIPIESIDRANLVGRDL